MKIVIACIFAVVAHCSFAQSFYVNTSDAIVALTITDDLVSSSEYVTKPTFNSVAEGLVVVKDSADNLLFAADGSGIYDKTGTLVPESDEMLAHHSSSEMAVCPVVGHPDEYYIFYNAEQCAGLYYSTIRVDKPGAIHLVEINVPLGTTQTYAEGLEIVKNPCQNQYFLVAFDCQEGFHTFSVDTNGISPPARTVHKVPAFSGRGTMVYQNGKLGYALAFLNKILLADLDASTGNISAVEEIAFPATNGMYGIGFTQNAKKVYVTDWNHRNIFGQPASPNLFAYDIASRRIASWTIDISNMGSEPSGLGQVVMNHTGQLVISGAGTRSVVLIDEAESAAPVVRKREINKNLSYGIAAASYFPVSMKPKITANSDPYLCEGETVALYVERTDYKKYQWYRDQRPLNSETEPVLIVSKPGHYQLVTENAAGCLDTLDQVAITKLPSFSVNLGDTIRSCASETVVLSYPSLVSHQLVWSTGDTTDQISIRHEGNYWLTVNNGHCEASDTVVVVFNKPGKPEIPNVFTPNNDKHNDFFEISSIFDYPVTLSVYNRWGALVYFSDDYQDDWNGEHLAAATYYYIISENNNCSAFHRGWVSIIR